jgi:hypothetical protein
MAREGACTGRYATLDLKEASDRVSLALVRRLFPRNWVEAFEACRSSGTVLPDGTYVPFDKFAPMGSALCFPVEALIFWSLAKAATVKDRDALKRLYRNRLRPDERGCLSVYGDDIICETSSYEQVVEVLEAVGLKVNTAKSYRSGPFRESCGHDYYLGGYVTPIRVKSPFRAEDEASCFRTCELLNRIIDRYGEVDARVVTGCCDLFREAYGFQPPVVPINRHSPSAESYGGKLLLRDPHHNIKLDGMTLHSRKRQKGRLIPWMHRLRSVKGRHNAKLHVWQIRVLTEGSIREEYPYDNWSCVCKSLLVSGPNTQAGVYALPKRHRYKYGWASL